jgi:hypothetical protein
LLSTPLLTLAPSTALPETNPASLLRSNLPPLPYLLLADRLAELYEMTFPGHPEWLAEVVVDWQDDTAVATAVEQFLSRVNGLFPVQDDIWDADLEVVEWRLYEIPLIPWGYDVYYDDDWEDLKEPAPYLLYMSYYHYSAGGFVRHEEFPECYPDHEVPGGLNPVRLVAILREGIAERLAAIGQNQQMGANPPLPDPLDALPDLIEMLHQDTGNAWLDVGEMSLAEGGGYPVWNQENIEWLAEEWQRAEPVVDGINRFLDWLNSSPEAVAEKLTAVRDRLLEAYNRLQEETDQPEPEETT